MQVVKLLTSQIISLASSAVGEFPCWQRPRPSHEKKTFLGLLNYLCCIKWVVRRAGTLEMRERHTEVHCRRILWSPCAEELPTVHQLHNIFTEEGSRLPHLPRNFRHKTLGWPTACKILCCLLSCHDYAPTHIRNTGRITTVTNMCTKVPLAGVTLLCDLFPDLCKRDKCSVCQWMNWRLQQEERSVDLKAGLLEVAQCRQWKQRQIEELWVRKISGFTSMETGIDFLHF